METLNTIREYLRSSRLHRPAGFYCMQHAARKSQLWILAFECGEVLQRDRDVIILQMRYTSKNNVIIIVIICYPISFNINILVWNHLGDFRAMSKRYDYPPFSYSFPASRRVLVITVKKQQL